MTWRWCSLVHLPAPLLLLLLPPQLGHAFPQFTSPAAGATVDLPTIQAQWKDSNTLPLISELTSYTLNLMMGGNDQDNMIVVQPFASDGQFKTTGNSGQGNLSPSSVGPLPNGFFFEIVCTTEHDTQITTYSDRFSISGLTGSTPALYINAVNALNGSTNGPTPSGISTSATPTRTSSASKTNPATVIVTATPTSGADSTTSSTPVTNNPHSHSSKLSASADIGIGVAFGLGGALSIAIAIFYFWRRSRKQKRVTSIDSGDDPLAKPELPAESPRRKHSTRIGFRQIAEADHGYPMSEMDSMNTKYELEGDSPPLVEAGSGRLSVSSDAVSTECGTLSSRGSRTLPPGSPRPPMSPRPPGPPGFI